MTPGEERVRQGGWPPILWFLDHSQVTGFSLSIQLADDQGLVLMTTVAMPVFSKQNETVSTVAVLPARCFRRVVF